MLRFLVGLLLIVLALLIVQDVYLTTRRGEAVSRVELMQHQPMRGAGARRGPTIQKVVHPVRYPPLVASLPVLGVGGWLLWTGMPRARRKGVNG